MNARARTDKIRPKAKVQKEKITYSSLRKYNFVTAALLAAQGVVVLVLSNPQSGVKSVTANFLTQDKVASSNAGRPVFAQGAHHLFDINLAYIIAAFFFVSALAYLLVATTKRKVYESDLQKGTNRARWIDYTFSLSIMMVAIALLVGVFDFTSLLMIFALTAAMSLLGLNMELRNKGVKQIDWATYYIGTGAGLLPWLVFAIYVWDTHAWGNGLPSFIYYILGSLFILFVALAVNMYFQYRKLGHWSTYLYGERAYIILSLLAKSALAWQVFAGTLRH